MMTTIGIISGEILDLLEQRNGVCVLGEIQSALNEQHDLVLMGLGWLLREGHIQIIDDPLRTSYSDRGKPYAREASMFDLIVNQQFSTKSRSRVKNMTDGINNLTSKIPVLMEESEGLLTLRRIEDHLNEYRSNIVMALGWLIREGHIQGLVLEDDIALFPMPKAKDLLFI